MEYCKGTIPSGRFAGFRCGNALPCRVHYQEEVEAIAAVLQERGPDEYPAGYYLRVAEDLHAAGVRTVRPFDPSCDLEEIQ